MIELIMVMVIIGVMASMFIINYPASLRKARDVQRQNDLKTYQSALEVYAMKHNGLYPTSGYIPIPTLCPALGLTDDVCPNDPSSGTYYYQTSTNGTKYTVWSSMENTDENYVVCSSGLTGLAIVTPADGICPTFSSVPTSAPLPTLPPGAPTNTPTPGVAPTNTPTPGVAPTNTPSPSAAPTNTPTPTRTPTPTQTPAPSTNWVVNSSSGVSCNSKCSTSYPGSVCVSVGYDSGAVNGLLYTKSGSSCVTAAADPSLAMNAVSGTACPSTGERYANQWTRCKCVIY